MILPIKNNSKKNILVISQDYDLYLNSYGIKVAGDPFLRHCKYQNVLKEKTNKDSEIIIIVFTNKFIENQVKGLKPNRELKIIGTNSINRIFFSIDMIINTLNLIRKNWIPDLITSQNPWGEALPAWIISKILQCSYLPQIHTDISSKFWIKENYLLNSYRRLSAKFILNNSSLIRVVSKSIAKNISIKYNIEFNKLVVAPVSISFFTNKKLVNKLVERKSKELIFNILYVGRFVKTKDLKLWIKTALYLLTIDKNFRFTLVGYGKELIKIKKIIKNSDYSNYFNFTNKVEYEKLPKYFENANLLLLTSFYEGFGRVILEAMNYGIPCVSTKSGGPEDLILNKINGFIVNKRCPKELANHIFILHKNRKNYQIFSHNSYSFSSKNFNTDYLTELYVNLLITSSSIQKSENF